MLKWQLIRRKLRRISKALANFPSAAYAISYLALIPAFALLYANLPNRFFHSTVQYEYAMNATRESLNEELLKEIKQEFRGDYGGDTFSKGNNQYDINSLRVAIIPNAVPNELDFSVLCLVTHEAGSLKVPGGGKTYATICQGVINMYLGDMKTPRYSGRSNYIFNVVTPASGFIGKEYLEGIFPFKVSPNSDDFRYLRIGESFQNDVIAYQKGVGGFPSGVTGNYLRMLYFSAMTITTVGYGDIVPITLLTRVLVGLQAVSGIVLIGLFLNALAYEANNPDIVEL